MEVSLNLKRVEREDYTRLTCESTAMRPKDVSDALNLNVIAKNHIWKVEPSCATTGEGIFEGLAWLSSHIKVPAK